MSEKSLFIKDLVRQVHKELLESQQEREAKGDSALFKVEKLTIEANFIVTDDQQTSAGIGFHLLKADAKVNYKTEQVHKVTLKLGLENTCTTEKQSPSSTKSGGGSGLPRGANPAPW